MSYIKKGNNYALKNNVNTSVHKIDKTVHNFQEGICRENQRVKSVFNYQDSVIGRYSYEIRFLKDGIQQVEKGEINSIDASEAILILVSKYPKAKGKVKKMNL